MCNFLLGFHEQEHQIKNRKKQMNSGNYKESHSNSFKEFLIDKP